MKGWLGWNSKGGSIDLRDTTVEMLRFAFGILLIFYLSSQRQMKL